MKTKLKKCMSVFLVCCFSMLLLSNNVYADWYIPPGSNTPVWRDEPDTTSNWVRCSVCNGTGGKTTIAGSGVETFQPCGTCNGAGGYYNNSGGNNSGGSSSGGGHIGDTTNLVKCYKCERGGFYNNYSCDVCKGKNYVHKDDVCWKCNAYNEIKNIDPACNICNGIGYLDPNRSDGSNASSVAYSYSINVSQTKKSEYLEVPYKSGETVEINVTIERTIISNGVTKDNNLQDGGKVLVEIFKSYNSTPVYSETFDKGKFTTSWIAPTNNSGWEDTYEIRVSLKDVTGSWSSQSSKFTVEPKGDETVSKQTENDFTTPTPSSTPQPTSTPAPISIPQPTSTPVPTNTSQPTPTPTNTTKGVTQSSADTITVEINGKQVMFIDQQPIIKDGRTLVPVRGVFEQLGYNVSWDGSTQTVNLSNSVNNILLVLGKSTFTTNGKTYNLDVPAQSINGRTMLPIRAVLESVGVSVDWDGNRRVVVLSFISSNNEPTISDPSW